MKAEIDSCVEFLTKILRTRNIAEEKVETFNKTLFDLLCSHYEDHWFPEKPFKGSAYRCVRIYQKMDVMIEKAGNKCGLSTADLFDLLPNELTIWVDPHEVSYRIGEDGSVGTLYENKEAKEALKASAKAAKAKKDQEKQQQLQQQLNNVLQQHQQQQQQQQALLTQSSTGDSVHSSPSSSPPPGLNGLRLSPVSFMAPPHPNMRQQPGQRFSPVNFFQQQQQQQQQSMHRRSPPHHIGGGLRTSPVSHQYPFQTPQHQQQQYPGATSSYHRQWGPQRQSPNNYMQRKTPSPIMTAEDYQLHRQQQQQLQHDLQESSDFLQQCKDQLRYYFPDSTGSSADPLNMDYLASTFVAS